MTEDWSGYLSNKEEDTNQSTATKVECMEQHFHFPKAGV
jgi:hypothetical protein